MLLHIGRGMKLMMEPEHTRRTRRTRLHGWVTGMPSTAGYRGFHVGLIPKAQEYNAKTNHQAISFWVSILRFEGECRHFYQWLSDPKTFLQPQKNRRQIGVSRLAVSANSAAQSVPMATHGFFLGARSS